MPGEDALRKWEAESQARGISQVLKFERQSLGQPLSPENWLQMKKNIQQEAIEKHKGGNLMSIDFYLDDCVIKSQKSPSASSQIQDVSK